MVFQPRNITPSFTSIDGAVNNTFTMEINTNSSVTAYLLRIIDFNNNSVYIGTKTTLITPLYNSDTLSISVPSSIGLVNGIDYKWTVRLYQTSADMLITKGVIQALSTTTSIYLTPNINIKPDMQLRIGSEIKTILTHNISTGETVVISAFSSEPTIGTAYDVLSDFIETVPENILYVRATPVVTISTFPALSVLDKKYFDFAGTYTQDDGVPLNYYLWNLYLVNYDGSLNLIDTSDKTYKADIKYSYDGFKSGESYKIELIVENEYGIMGTSGLQDFNVSYTIIDYFQKPVATMVEGKDAVEVNWTTPTSFNPASGTETITKLYDNPYMNTNSVLIQTNDLVYNNNTDNIGDMPTNSRITTQLKPTAQFFYDYSNIFNSLIPLFDIKTDEADDAGNINIFIHKNKLVAITPFLDDGITKVESVVSGSTSTDIVLETDITETQLYITFPEHNNYTERIASYSDITKIAIMDKELPFTPSEGEDYYLNETLEAIFYIPNPASLSSTTSTAGMSLDYIWNDDITWNDTYYWVEGGTEIERIAGLWWKAEIIIGNSIILDRGGM